MGGEDLGVPGGRRRLGDKTIFSAKIVLNNEKMLKTRTKRVHRIIEDS